MGGVVAQVGGRSRSEVLRPQIQSEECCWLSQSSFLGPNRPASLINSSILSILLACPGEGVNFQADGMVCQVGPEDGAIKNAHFLFLELADFFLLVNKANALTVCR